MEISFEKSYLLFLLIPTIFFIIVTSWRLLNINKFKKSVITFLRTVIAMFLILALSGMSVKDFADKTETVFAVDISDSTYGSHNKAKEFINKAQKERPEEESVGLVVFGGNPAVEEGLDKKNLTAEMNSIVDSSQTDISMAIKQSETMFSENAKKRLVILTDGNETTGDAVREAKRIKDAGIKTFVYDLGLNITNEVGIREMKIPAYVNSGTKFGVETIIDSIGNAQAEIRLYRDGNLVIQENIELRDGENNFSFSDTAIKGGAITYMAEIVSKSDTMAENNRAYGFCWVEDVPSILILDNNGSGDELKKLLEASKLKVVQMNVSSAPKKTEDIISYDTVILANVKHDMIPNGFEAAVDGYVKYAGGGLIMTGGADSFAMGNYYGTAIEEMLPVTMDIESESEKPDLAMVMVIDRSGSMEMDQSGFAKMEIAKEASIRGLEQLKSQDLLGIVSFDSTPEWKAEIQNVGENRDALRLALGSIRPGGGTSILPALRSAYNGLSKVDARLKHIILLTDGQAEQDGYTNVLKSMEKEGMTLSTIAVGKDSDQKLLKFLATKGNGRYYYTDRFTDLPEIFVNETRLAGRNYINERDFYPIAGDISPIIEETQSVPILHGYVGTTAKPRADVPLKSDKDEPILAHWQYGVGNTAVWTSDVSGQWSSDWLNSEAGTEIIRQMVSLTMSRKMSSDIDVSAVSEFDKSKITIKMPYDKDVTHILGVVLSSDGKKYDVDFSQKSAGVYESNLDTTEKGAYIITLNISKNNGKSEAMNSGFELSYSGEYDVRKFEGGSALCREIVYAGDGEILAKAEELFDTQLFDTGTKFGLTNVILWISAVLFLIDIFIRKFDFILDRLEKCFSNFRKKRKNKREALKEIKKESIDMPQNDVSIESKSKAENNKSEAGTFDTLAGIKRNRKK